MNKKQGFPESDSYTKFSISFSRDVERFLDRVKDEIRDKGGKRISRSEIIRAALRYVQSLKVDLENVEDEDELLERFKTANKK